MMIAMLVGAALAAALPGSYATQCDFSSQSYTFGSAVEMSQNTSNSSNWQGLETMFSVGQYSTNNVVQQYVIVTYGIDQMTQEWVNTSWTATTANSSDSWNLIQYSNSNGQLLCVRESSDQSLFVFPGKIVEEEYILITPGCPTRDQLRNPGIYLLQTYSNNYISYTTTCPGTSDSSGRGSHAVGPVIAVVGVAAVGAIGFFAYRRFKRRNQGYQPV
jgi:hypothetical protein